MTTMEQVVENIHVAKSAEANSLTARELAMIEEVKQLFRAKTKVNCTACAYCMPCPVGINIPTCLAAYNDHWIFDAAPEAKQRYGMLSKIYSPASNCVECGQCEIHCPQGIAIRDELKQVAALFE